MANNKHGLGRGLGALFGDEDINGELLGGEGGADIRHVKTAELLPGKFQPRQNFSAEAIDALADSIKEKGVLQPILVRRRNDKYEIIAGERRFRAAQKAKLEEVPVIIKDMADNEVLEVALVENIVRQDLTAVEEAAGFDRLMHEFAYTQEQLSKIVGKSRSHIANTLRLLTLPENVKDLINQGRLSAGHARTLIGLENATELAAQIVAEGLSVRQAEELVSKIKSLSSEAGKSRPVAKKTKDSELLRLESELSQKFGLKVQINAGQKGKGKVILCYNDLSELENIIEKIER